MFNAESVADSCGNMLVDFQLVAEKRGVGYWSTPRDGEGSERNW